MLFQNLHPLDYFLKEHLKTKEMRQIPQEMLNRVAGSFNVPLAAVLSYSSVVHGTKIELLTEKV